MKKLYLVTFISIVLLFTCLSIIYLRYQNHFQQTPPIYPQNTVPPSTAPLTTQAHILFTGDIMMDRYIREMATKYGGYDYILSEMKIFLNSFDAVISDLEGPITDRTSISIGSVIGSPANYIFTFDPRIGKTLFDHNIRIVSIGNNHILNQGEEGLAQTITSLNQNTIEFFGNTGNNQQYRVLIKEINGIKIGLLNYNEFVKNGEIAVFEDMKMTRKHADILIVFSHWGPEYIVSAPVAIQTLAKQFIDEGADIVIGAHPHVVMNSEIYAGKTIYYSLGNFVMDQYFSRDTMNGIALEVHISKLLNDTDYVLVEHPITMDMTGKTKLRNP